MLDDSLDGIISFTMSAIKTLFKLPSLFFSIILEILKVLPSLYGPKTSPFLNPNRISEKSLESSCLVLYIESQLTSEYISIYSE